MNVKLLFNLPKSPLSWDRLTNMCFDSDWLCRSSAVKFLVARKFDVERSLVLYQQHELMRLREGLTVFDSSTSPLKEELLTGKFTILPSR